MVLRGLANPHAGSTSNLSTGAGVSGNLKGTVGVFGFNPSFGAGTNAAVVFDSFCGPGHITSDCSVDDDSCFYLY